MEQSLKLYRASAGAGKTHKLTEEFLKLLFKYPDNYRQILAVTFTKKATGEMKSRIMEELHKLAKGEKSEHIQVLTAIIAEDKIQERAELILKKILHDFSHFSVTTIDSFFQKILTSFLKEIGLHSGYVIEMDQNLVTDQVVDQLLLELGENKLLTQWLVKFSKEKIVEGLHWDIEKELKQLSKEIFKEDFKIKEQKLIAVLANMKNVEAFQKRMFVIQNEFEKQQKEIGEKGVKVILSLQLSVNDFSYGKSGVAASFAKMVNNTFERDKKRVLEAIDIIDKWFSKTSAIAEGTKQQAFASLNPLLKQAFDLYDKDGLKYNTACEVLRYYNVFGIIAEILRKLKEFRQNEHKLLISDVAGILKQIIGENDSSFVFEKTANWYKHYIIDEFQDTSLFQWDNFKPLIENSIAEGTNLNMIVGDVKQSIYRWRGGNWTLINNRVEEAIQGTEVLNLNQNWRSGINIIKFNNTLFNRAAEALQNALPEFLQKNEIFNIKKIYEDSMQYFPLSKTDHAGYVQIKFYEKEEEENNKWKEQAKLDVIERINSFVQQTYTYSDMAILVRDNREAKEMADILLQNNIDVISSESLSLSNSKAVKIVMAVIGYLNEPSDAINKTVLAYEYAQYKNVEPIEESKLHDLFTIHELQLLNNKEHLTYLKKLPLYELVEELISVFDLSVKQEELPYLQAFQDVVLSYSRKRKTDLSSFLDWWIEYGKKKTVFISEGQNAVQIMTVHKSKGLAFKIVFLPFCNWKIGTDPMKENIIWAETTTAPFNDFPYLPIKYSKDLANTDFAAAYYEEMLNGYIDNLNLLYVASTRAIDAMVIMSERPNSNKKNNSNKNDEKIFAIKTIGDLLFTVLQQGNAITLDVDHYIQFGNNWNEETGVFEIGEIKNKIKPAKNENQFSLTAFHSYPWRNRITIRRHAKDYFLPSNDTGAEKINYGTLMHEVLKNMRKTEDYKQVLENVYMQGKISVEQKLHLTTSLQKFLSLDEVRDWFDLRWKVKNERAVLLGSGKIKIPDKVLIDGKTAIVIDFKTGKESEAYEKQIKEYMDILQKMGYENVKGFLAYIEESKIVSVL